ncbi:TetR/AcrR family transcriptional regulator [Burkholderia sp. Ac-20345]|uniref:TetR/AcrR family transcriptional regulator n=1 Tax=Burkholderia sp. Ac-20345 TaxID=2703891 RepID=UPI00197B19DA|nr:TetR/AcrR family transcriptional regulator [Burkholderia sp. Ac-20345]MBN3779378.1 TetR/AcrR family transcriptional regulator [Burkholderia sp. Ac-20345]
MVRSTRNRLLSHAERLIRRHGMSSFTFTRLAESASLTEAVVTECFGTKEALFIELIHAHSGYLEHELREIAFEYRDAESRLIAYACLASEQFEQGVPSLPNVLSAARASVPHEVGAEIEKLYRLQLNWLRQTVQEHHAAKDVAPTVSAGQAACLLVSALEGDAIVECALNTSEPSATSFLQVLTLLGISRR